MNTQKPIELADTELQPHWFIDLESNRAGIAQISHEKAKELQPPFVILGRVCDLTLSDFSKAALDKGVVDVKDEWLQHVRNDIALFRQSHGTTMRVC